MIVGFEKEVEGGDQCIPIMNLKRIPVSPKSKPRDPTQYPKSQAEIPQFMKL
jgi:hypothetical protein